MLSSGRPPVACVSVPTGTRREASQAKVFTSGVKYSLATISAPADGTVSGVNTPLLTSSWGASLVIRRVCGSSVCQHAASLGNTRRSLAVTSA